MSSDFHFIELRVPERRFESWDHFVRETPEYSIGLEVIDDTPGHRGHWVHFDHHAGVIREVTMSAAMQAYLAIRQGRLMEKWLCHRRPVPVYVWNADQDVCLAAFILEYHELLEQLHADPLLRWIVQYNNKIDVCGGLYPVDLDELVRNHVTWVFEPYRQQRMRGKGQGDEALVRDTIRQVCNRLEDLLRGRAGIAPISVEPEILYESPHDFVIVDEKGDPNSRLVLASRGHRNLISLICTRNTGRYTYSIIRGSPYDEDLFPVDRLIQAFQAAEDRPKIWGGSNMAAGSDSELGSSLHWTRLRDIAETVLQEAWLEKEAPAPPDHTRPRTMVVGGVKHREELQPTLRACGADVLAVRSCQEARRALERGIVFDAIFTSLALPDGGFRALVRMAGQIIGNIPVVVCVPRADGGWTDLLESGAFGLLTEPYTEEDVQRMLASIRWSHKTEVPVAGAHSLA
jgi:hypothetical protein